MGERAHISRVLSRDISALEAGILPFIAIRGNLLRLRAAQMFKTLNYLDRDLGHATPRSKTNRERMVVPSAQAAISA